MLEEGAGLLVLRWVLCEGEGLAGPSCIGEMWKERKGLWGVVGFALRGDTSVGWGDNEGEGRGGSWGSARKPSNAPPQSRAHGLNHARPATSSLLVIVCVGVVVLGDVVLLGGTCNKLKRGGNASLYFTFSQSCFRL